MNTCFHTSTPSLFGKGVGNWGCDSLHGIKANAIQTTTQTLTHIAASPNGDWMLVFSDITLTCIVTATTVKKLAVRGCFASYGLFCEAGSLLDI